MNGIKSSYLAVPFREKLPVIRHRSAEPGLDHNRRDTTDDGRSCPSSPAIKKSIRLVVLGSPNTGKTAILSRFLNEDFNPSYCPTVENFHRKMYRIRGELYQLDILDTGGNRSFPASRRLQLLTGDLFVIVCSVDSEGSFSEALRLRDEIRELKVRPVNDPEGLPILIALNKTDLPPANQEITVKACDEKVKEIGVLFPCSAKTGAGINGIFAALFVLARLPKQMLPQQHVFLGPRSSEAAGELDSDPDSAQPHSALTRLKSRRFNKKEERAAVSYKESDARRPSLRSDLLVLRAKTSVPSAAFVATSHQPSLAMRQPSLSPRSIKSPPESRKCVIM